MVELMLRNSTFLLALAIRLFGICVLRLKVTTFVDVRIGRSESKLIFNIEIHFFFSRSFIPSLKPIKMIQLSNLI